MCSQIDHINLVLNRTDVGCKIPRTHQAFSTLAISSDATANPETLDEAGNFSEPEPPGDEEAPRKPDIMENDAYGSWLSDDEIEDMPSDDETEDI